jgi:hypothetical protein
MVVFLPSLPGMQISSVWRHIIFRSSFVSVSLPLSRKRRDIIVNVYMFVDLHEKCLCNIAFSRRRFSENPQYKILRKYVR